MEDGLKVVTVLILSILAAIVAALFFGTRCEANRQDVEQQQLKDCTSKGYSYVYGYSGGSCIK